MPLIYTDPLVHKFERWARERLAEGFSLDQAATELGTSKRTLARRMQNVLGQIAARILPGSADRARRSSARDQPGQRRPDRRRSRLCRRRDVARAAAPEAWPRRARHPPQPVKPDRPASAGPRDVEADSSSESHVTAENAVGTSNWLLMLSTSWPSFSVLATTAGHSGSA
jgi:AraC-like DNA-binding protein